MRPHIIISLISALALSVSIAVNADAQPVESFRASTNITPQVESYQIARSGDLTPSLYTGAMTYSLPLYTYTDPDFVLPITLDYNYDGYKVTRSAGTVGLGWALNYGGVITREIRGYKDEYRQQISTSSAAVRYGYYWAYRNHTGLGTNFTINRPKTPALVTATPAELVRHLSDDLYEDIPVYTSGDSYDLSPDLFHFSFGPYSGDFLMNNDGTLTLTSSTHPQGEIDVIVETTTGMDGYSLKFTIKTGDGYEYTFGDVTSAREYHISRVIKDECPDETNIAGTMSGWTDTAWKLTKIKAPNGRTALFSYAEKPNLTPTVTYSYSTYTQLLPTSASMPTPRDSVPSWERTNLNYGYSHPIEQIRICSIDGSRTESTISFSWTDKTSSEDEMSAINYENMTVSSYLNSHPLRIRNVKLSSVSVKNIDSEVVRRFSLNQSKIGSSSGPKRMVLESVNDSRNGLWLFEYDNGTGSLPEYDSRRHDLWGFWCQSYFDPRQQANWDDLIQSTPNFVERLDYLKSGSLTKITYPTVGWSEISYERNEADHALNRTPHNLPRLDYWSKECGGIRVKEIFSKPFDSDNVFKRLYEYSEGEILSLRWMRIEENYWKYWGTSERTYLKGIFYSNDGLSNGSYDISIMSQSGRPQNRIATLRYLSEDGSVMLEDSEFYNGLGYLCQAISESASGDGKDLITHIEYDSMFRPNSKSYLPFPSNSGTQLIVDHAAEYQSQWYSSNFHDSRPFVERSFESGSSGRPLTEQKPGDIYQTSGRKIHFLYSLNDSSDSIFTFRYDYPASTSDHPSVACIGQYQEGTLSKTTAISEDNDTTQTFIDAAGRLVLERRLNDGIRHDTYHIYDLRDSVVCVIQPIGSSRLYSGKEMPFNGTFVQDSCFTWQYDGKGRMTESHTPGAGTKSYLYDLRGRMIYMSDSNIIRAAGNGWYYIYDDLNRLIESGIGIRAYNNETILDGLANGFDIKTFLYNASTLKEYCYYSRMTSHQPSDIFFEPVNGLASVADVCDTRCITMPSFEKVYYAPYFYEAYKYIEETTLFHLNTNDGYIQRAFWYDRKGRVIQKLETTSDGWTSRYTTKYDFAGNALATMETHTTPFGRSDSLLTVNTYDKRGRLTSYNRTLNGQEFKTVRYSYDFAGRILKKTVSGNSSDATADLAEDYSRDIRGWMTDITTNTSTLGTVFSESLGYMSSTIPATPLFSGNISTVSMNCFGQGPVQNAYMYDHLGRLLGNNRIVDGVTTTVGTEHNIQYDLNGNINRLTRDDGNQRYTMWMTHTGNRIKDITTDLGVTDGFLRSYTNNYDFNGNITNICQSNDIWYNILNLPHHSAGKTYEYYSDGTKAEFSDSTGYKLIYRGNFTYRQNDSITIWLESVAYPDGRIHSAPQIPINGYADCWYIKDRLGNVRVVHCLNSGGNLPVFEVNDYLPFGGRIPNASQPAFSLNRYRYAGKEEHNGFAACDGLTTTSLPAIDFGARFLTPFLGAWTSPDPIAAIASSKTPYGYCSSNPINKVDKTGEWDVTVHLYKDRKEYGYGIAIVTTNSGNEIYRFNVRAEGVKGHNRHITGADTPLGTYDIPNSSPWISGGSRASYGPNPRLSMIGIQGEIVDTKRNSIRIHGGRQEVYNNRSKQWDKINSPKLKKTYGCLRAFDEDIKDFKVITDNLMSNDSNEYPGQVLIIDDLEKVINSSGKNFVEIVIDYQMAPKYIDWKNIWQTLRIL